MNAAFRHDDQKDKYFFHDLDILTLSSFSPIDALFRAVSYRVKANISRIINPKTQKEGYAFHIGAEGGGSYALTNDMIVYALSGLEGAYGGFLPQNHWEGVSFSAGILVNFDTIGLKTEIKKILATDTIGNKLEILFDAEYYLSKNYALGLSAKYTGNKAKDFQENIFYLKRHF